MAYVTIPQCIFFILKRIGETPLQQVKSVRTAGQPTGAKAGAFATIMSVAVGAYQGLPGVAEATSTIGAWAATTTAGITGSLDSVMGGALTNLTVNPVAAIHSLSTTAVNDCQSLVAGLTATAPGLDLSGITASLGTSTMGLDDVLSHTDRLSGLTADLAVGSANINLDMVKSTLGASADLTSELTSTFRSAALAAGKVGDEITQFVNESLISANNSMLSITNNKLGLIQDPTELYGSLQGTQISAVQTALDGVKSTLANPLVTQLSINSAQAQLDAAITDMVSKKAAEELKVQEFQKAFTVMNSLAQTTAEFTDPVYSGLMDLIVSPDKKALLNETAVAMNAVTTVKLSDTNT